MQATGLPMPGLPPQGGAQPSATVGNLGGFLPMGNAAAALRLDAVAVDSAYQTQQSQPVIAGLAAHIRSFWTNAQQARTEVQGRMLAALRARRGEYSPEKVASIAQQRQPLIYMMVASAKMRQIEALLRDVIIGTGAEKPWTLRPTPVPELPPNIIALAVQQLTSEIEQSAASGFPPSIEQAQMRLRQMRDELTPRLEEEARLLCDRMESKMEDQLVEGAYLEALDQFITDLATFPTAFLAGPVIRRKAQLTWSPEGEMVVEDRLVPEWERVDPFDMYPAPWATKLANADLVRKHRLTRSSLNEMMGVEGFSEPAIRKVLEQYDDRGFREWLSIDSQKANAEGKTHGQTLDTGLIDALQYWGSASGRMLVDWGVPKDQVPDLAKEYQVEAWLIGAHVIKAVLNADPLARRPYYSASFQMVPGSVWGNSPYDLMHDCQDMCNGAARAMAANLGISSGPQVAILSNRIPAGEDVTELYPWKIWQFESDPMGSTAAPISFFQPQSNANELMTVYERFSSLADEYTGIPRYMAGFETAGAGRTASGMSMMIGNASKATKQVVGTIDTYVLTPMLERLYYHNMRYSDDPQLKGDVKVVARGAASLVTKESAQIRTTEFLQATGNPIDMQIIGMEGRAELLRHASKRLDLNPDKVVPPMAVLKQRALEQQAAMSMQQQGTPAKPGGGEQLADGTPTTDTFSPKPQG